MRRITSTAVSAVTVLGLLAGCGGGSSNTFLGYAKNDPINIAVKSDQPGTGYLDSSTYQYSGFDILVAKQLSQDIGFEENLDPKPSEDRVNALLNRDDGLVIATFSITSPRVQQGIWFAGPYAVTRQGFMVRKDHASQIHTTEDLEGKSICTWSGTTSANVLQAELPHTPVDPVADASSCMTRLQDGKDFAASTDQIILYGFMQQYSDLTVVPGVTIGPQQYYGVGLNPTDKDGRSNLGDCRLLEKTLRDYVGSTQWRDDFSSSLPALVSADPNWANEFQPRPAQFDELSCKSKIDG